MSTARFNTLRDADGNNPIAQSVIAEGTTKAWAKFTGLGVIAIRDSTNVSALTDNGVGRYALTFTNAFTSNNYAVSGVCSSSATSAQSVFSPLNLEAENLPTLVNVFTVGITFFDNTVVSALITGDLA